jgi:Ca-activated chloride channel family protein
MTITTNLIFSHKYSIYKEIKEIFKLIILPEKVNLAKGIHYIILLDTSSSMKGLKIEIAKRAAKELLNKIPAGNKVTFITFSNEINPVFENADSENLNKEVIDNIKADGPTPLYKALTYTSEVARKNSSPGFIILLTDGEPTDEVDVRKYSEIFIPNNYHIYSFGIGDEYREEILKILSDLTGGIFYHINDPLEIIERIPKVAITEVAAKNVEIDINSPTLIRLLNYSGPPVRIGVIENTVKIIGEIIIPPNYEGNVLKINIKYYDPVSENEKLIEKEFNISYTNDRNLFLNSINKELLYEYRYYELLTKYSQLIKNEKISEATITLKSLIEISEATRRVDLIETTRKLSAMLESTKRINSSEITRRISKEVSSEITRKLRE